VGLRVWRWPSREEVLPNDEAHRGSVSSLTIAPDGLVVTASEDFTIRIWDPTTGKQKRKLQHHHGVRAIAVSPDGLRLVSSSLDDTLRLWDIASGREIHRLPGHGVQGWRRAVAFSADGRSLASFGDDCRLLVWDVETGKALLEHKLRPTAVKVPAAGSNREYLSLSEARFSPDASLLVLGIGKLFVFDVKTGRELRTLDHENTTVTSPVAFSPDSRRMLAGSSGQVQTTLPDGRIRRRPTSTHGVTMWELGAGQVEKQLTLSGGVVGAVAFSADGQRFAVATNLPKFQIAIYDTASGAEQHTIEPPFLVTALAFAPDGRTLVAGLGDSTALVFALP
jgi:WD40 repeat protein